MRFGRGLFGFLRWCVSISALVVAGASALSLFFHFGVIRTTPYPGGMYAPIHTTIMMIDGGFFYDVSQGAGHAQADSPYVVIGTHWRWRRVPPGGGRLWWRASLNPWIEAPAWLLVGPPALLSLGMWTPSVLRRLARKHYQCSCGYDRRGLAADAKCPECGMAGG